MLVRTITEQDWPEWLRMRMALWPENEVDEHLSEMQELWTDTTCVTFVAVRPDGSLGGFLEAGMRKYAEGCRTSPVGYIEGWYVDDDLRRMGVGKLLLQTAENWARHQMLSEMASDCEFDNETSQHAHLALGYQ